MFDVMTIMRLFISQIFVIFIVLTLVPLKAPKMRNLIIVIASGFIITLANALIIIYVGLSFYIRYYFLTLTLPYILVGLFFSEYKLSKFVFAVLTTQMIGNLAIINGLFASYLFYGQNTPWIDTIARVITYIILLPIVFKLIKPIFTKMSDSLKRGWWLLNLSLIFSYALAYFVLFVPVSIFQRPEYFSHAYIGIFLSMIIYAIIFSLFAEVKNKIEIEQDKQKLSSKVTLLAAQSEKMKAIAFNDALTGVRNRYSLYTDMNQFIFAKQSFLIVFIDLNNLKEINDKYNHQKGDVYLTQFALAIQKGLKQRGEVYRYGGDEFVCLIKQDELVFDYEVLSKEIEKEMDIDTPFYGFCYGVAAYPKDGSDTEELIDFADQEMYVQKKDH